MTVVRSRVRAALLGLTVVTMAACGQAVSAPEGGGASSSPATVGAPLPVRDAGPLDWQVIALPRGTYEARVDRQLITLVRIDEAAEPDAGPEEVMVLRRADGQRLAGYLFKPSYHPLYWLVHQGALILLEPQGPTALTFGLNVVDLESGRARPIPLRSVRDLLPADPVVVGDEILVVGFTAAPRDTCLVALRPPAYTERTVECGLSDRVADLVPGPDGPLWTRDCQQWRQLLPDGSIRSLPLRAPICDVDSSHPAAVLAGWQLDEVDQGIEQPRALVASTPAHTVGEVSNGIAVACGEHVYWVSGTHGQPGQRLMRWRPGADHAETVLPGRPDTNIWPPHCIAGVLNIGIGPNTHQVPFHEFRILDHP
jgi:hypothetical protein